MRKVNNAVLYTILGAGFLFLVGGFLAFVYGVESDLKFVYQIWPLLSLLAGVLIVYFDMIFVHKTYLLFIGAEFAFASCYALVLQRGLTFLGFSNGWPLFIVLTGVVLILSCLYKRKRLTPNYFVPAIVMIFMGILFMLFSLDIIKMPLSKFFAKVGPFIMIVAGTASIVFFFIQGGHKELVIKEESADNEY